MTREQAYMLVSLAVDLRVSQVVNGAKGIHAMLPKSILKSKEKQRRGPPKRARAQPPPKSPNSSVRSSSPAF